MLLSILITYFWKPTGRQKILDLKVTGNAGVPSALNSFDRAVSFAMGVPNF
jgi:hypothetical protein